MNSLLLKKLKSDNLAKVLLTPEGENLDKIPLPPKSIDVINVTDSSNSADQFDEKITIFEDAGESRVMKENSLNLEEQNAENLTEFTQALVQHSLFYVLPKSSTKITESVGVFDTSTKILWTGLTDLKQCFKKYPFLRVRRQRDKKEVGVLHASTKLLWRNDFSSIPLQVDAAQDLLEVQNIAGLKNWQLPKKTMLAQFAKHSDNPFSTLRSARLRTHGSGIACYWLTELGCCDIEHNSWPITRNRLGHIFACNLCWQNASYAELLLQLGVRKWELVNLDTNEVLVQPPVGDARWQTLSTEELLHAWTAENLKLQSVVTDAEQESIILNPTEYLSSSQLSLLDYTPCRLPELDNAQLSDPEKGVWELWGQDAAMLKTSGLVARDPSLDIQHRAVAIDFGTSSTVVAMDSASGARELLRIGVRDFFQPVSAQDFENPTVLECVDYPEFFKAWTAKAYRPELNWDWMRAAHEARERYRENPGDTQILSSVLPLLKQWALRSGEQRKRMTDQQNPAHEMELEPHTERNPSRGQVLGVSADYIFDPIELYAWYLGMAINWRGRGLFLKYYLSFPVKYPRQVKKNILASFRRGLQRSLPNTLIEHHPHVLNEFEVNDLANEPAAYVAAALPHLDVKPTDEGVPYAVFDFGGGTSDFDYGVLRWSNSAEEDQGYDRVFEHLASSGDNYLGGENLLEHLVFESFKHNLKTLREQRIQFTQPLDAQPFAGSEAFVSRAQAAQTNAIMLADKLRAFMENDRADMTSPIKLDLIDVNRNKQTCELSLDLKALDQLLADRIRRGVEAFLIELARVHEHVPADTQIHLLLAGNGSRSRHIKAFFDTDGDLWQELLAQAFGRGREDWDGYMPKLVVHHPLPMNNEQPHAPTAKTGVALGLLRLVPGENTLLKNRLHAEGDGDSEAPFTWFAGRVRRGTFAPSILPNARYGEWTELGPLQEGVFSLYTSNSPRALNLHEGDSELRKYRLSFSSALANSRVFARPTKPTQLELIAVPDLAEVESAVPRLLDLS